jgi:hypothetical protein
MHADRSTRCWLALVHQLLSKVEQLDAGSDGPGRGMRGCRFVQPRFGGLQPGPIA